MLLQEVKRRKNLLMGWINYQKAYDMDPHSWVIESLILTCGSEKLGEVPIKREIFQGNAPSPLLFVIVVKTLTHILRTANPGYEF